METKEAQKTEHIVDKQTLERVAKELQDQVRAYISTLSKKRAEFPSRCLFLVIAFSVWNIIAPYFVNIPYIGFIVESILDAVDFSVKMAPSAILPEALLTWQIGNGGWVFGIVLAVLALLPYVIALLIQEKHKKFSLWMTVVWYAVDAVVFVYGAVTLFVGLLAENAGTPILVKLVFFRFLDLLFRVFVFSVLFERINALKKRDKEWNKLVDLAMVCYAVVNGEEAAKKEPRSNAEKFCTDMVVKTLVKMEAERKEKEKRFTW